MICYNSEMHHFQVRLAGDNLDDDNIKGRPLFDEGFGGGASAAQWLQMAKTRRNKVPALDVISRVFPK